MHLPACSQGLAPGGRGTDEGCPGLPASRRPHNATASAPTQSTLVHVLAAGWPRVPRGASADGLAIDRVGVAVGALVAGVADACVVEVAQQTCAPMWTLAVEGSYTVMAGGTLETGSTSTVVDVLTAVLASPAIDTHAVVATMGIVAGPAILTGVGHELTLVHILCAVLTCRGHRTINFPSCYTPTPGRGLEATLSRKSSQLTCATCTSYPILQPKGLSPHG